MAMDCCTQDLSPAVTLFRSLGDPTRLAIALRLAEGEARVVDLTRALGLAQSTVSKHLACLRDCRLVDFRTESRQSFYSLTRPELIAGQEGPIATGSPARLHSGNPSSRRAARNPRLRNSRTTSSA